MTRTEKKKNQVNDDKNRNKRIKSTMKILEIKNQVKDDKTRNKRIKS